MLMKPSRLPDGECHSARIAQSVGPHEPFSAHQFSPMPEGGSMNGH